jgi:hypothetical protein
VRGLAPTTCTTHARPVSFTAHYFTSIDQRRRLEEVDTPNYLKAQDAASSPGFELESVALARTECMPNGQDPKYRLQTPFACRSQEHIANLLASNVVNSSTPVYLSNCCLWTPFDASRHCLGMSAGMKGWQFDPACFHSSNLLAPVTQYLLFSFFLVCSCLTIIFSLGVCNGCYAPHPQEIEHCTAALLTAFVAKH